MVGVKYFPSFVQEAVDLMGEKEIRIRTLVEELNMVQEGSEQVMNTEDKKS